MKLYYCYSTGNNVAIDGLVNHTELHKYIVAIGYTERWTRKSYDIHILTSLPINTFISLLKHEIKHGGFHKVNKYGVDEYETFVENFGIHTEDQYEGPYDILDPSELEPCALTDEQIEEYTIPSRFDNVDFNKVINSLNRKKYITYDNVHTFVKH